MFATCAWYNSRSSVPRSNFGFVVEVLTNNEIFNENAKTECELIILEIYIKEGCYYTKRIEITLVGTTRKGFYINST